MGGSKDKRSALHAATLSGWYRFEREGEKWVPVERALTYWSMTCLAVDPEDPNLVYVGTERSGLFVSRDGGATWKRPDPNMPRLMITSLLTLPGNVLVGTVPAALYRARRGGWEDIEEFRRSIAASSFPPNPDLGARTRYLAVDPAVPTRLYAGIEVGGLLLSEDGGFSWLSANDGLSDPDVHQLLASARTPNLVVAACGEGVFRSSDRGAHWEEITPPGARTYGMAVTEDGNGVIYLGITRGRPNTWLRAERADGAILRSRDAGSHWEPVVQGLRGGVMDLCANPEGDGVFAGTSEGELLAVDSTGCRVLASGLPCINAVSLGA